MKLALSLLTVIAMAMPAMASTKGGGGGGGHASASSHVGGGGAGGFKAPHVESTHTASHNDYVSKAPRVTQAPRETKTETPHYIARATPSAKTVATTPSRQIQKPEPVRGTPTKTVVTAPSKQIQKAPPVPAKNTAANNQVKQSTVPQNHQPSMPIRQATSPSKPVSHNINQSVVQQSGKVRPATEKAHNIASAGRLKDPKAVIPEGKSTHDNTLNGKTELEKNSATGSIKGTVKNSQGKVIKTIDQNSKGTTYTNAKSGVQTHISPKGNQITRTEPNGVKTISTVNKRETIKPDGSHQITYRGGTKVDVSAKGIRTVTRVNGVRVESGHTHIVNNITIHERNVYVAGRGSPYHYNYIGYRGHFGWGFNAWVPCYHPWIFGFGFYPSPLFAGYYVFNPWVNPWVYNYGWANYSWFGYWGGFFNPYPTYYSPDYYLANAYFDYSFGYLAARRARIEAQRAAEIAREQALSEEDRLEQQEELDAAADLRAQEDELENSEVAATQDGVLTDTVRDQIRTEVADAVARAKDTNVAPDSDVQSPQEVNQATSSNSVALEAVFAAHRDHVFEVNMGADGDNGDTITATTNHHSDPNDQNSDFLNCQLGMGDYIVLADPNFNFKDDTKFVAMKVLKSNKGSCAQGQVVDVQMADLQTMLNEFSASLVPMVDKMKTLPGVPTSPAPTVAQQQ